MNEGDMMNSISKLCKAFHLSRSTLLYYDSIGLLNASGRTRSNYRIYSEADKARLEQICIYREAGVPLAQIKDMIDNAGKDEEKILLRRLEDVNQEIYLLRLQQKIIVEILRSKNANDKDLMIDRPAFVSLLKTSGVKDDVLEHLHIEFEKRSPKEHQTFLEFLGIDKDTIRLIREKAKEY